jgi:hypothetical protein
LANRYDRHHCLGDGERAGIEGRKVVVASHQRALCRRDRLSAFALTRRAAERSGAGNTGCQISRIEFGKKFRSEFYCICLPWVANLNVRDA